MMATGGLVGIAIGVVMLIFGIVSIAKSMGKGHQVQIVAPVPRRVGPLDKNCRICRKDVKWWQLGLNTTMVYYTKNAIGMREGKEPIPEPYVMSQFIRRTVGCHANHSIIILVPFVGNASNGRQTKGHINSDSVLDLVTIITVLITMLIP